MTCFETPIENPSYTNSLDRSRVGVGITRSPAGGKSCPVCRPEKIRGQGNILVILAEAGTRSSGQAVALGCYRILTFPFQEEGIGLPLRWEKAGVKETIPS